MNARRRGISLIECLVVVSIIGLLIALLIPAVQAARESSRRASCVNNLKQIGLSLNSHVAANGRFPFGIRPDGRSAKNNSYFSSGYISAHIQLLPFLDSAPLFNTINIPASIDVPSNNHPSPPWTNRENSTAFRTVVNVFLCPSDTSPTQPGNNYRATVGPHPAEFDSTRIPGGAGAFPAFQALSPQNFRDGLSNTVGFSERIRGSGLGKKASKSSDIWFSGVVNVVAFIDSDIMNRVCFSFSQSEPTFTGAGSWWSAGLYDETLYNHVAVPNWDGMDCSAGSETSEPRNFPVCSMTARSRHYGGVNSLFMDGSVRWIRSTIHLQIWRALATRSGEESLSQDAY